MPSCQGAGAVGLAVQALHYRYLAGAPHDRPDQTKPNQTRPDQTRQDPTESRGAGFGFIEVPYKRGALHSQASHLLSALANNINARHS